MKILVIGSLGTVGRPLCEELRYRGNEVIESDLQHCDLENYIRCDIREERQVANLFAFAQPEVVYNLAAEFGRHNGEEYYEQCWSTNVIGGRHVMEACISEGSNLIHMSSSEAYGETPQSLMQESDTENFPLRHHNDYAMSKWVNEQQIMNLEREGLECVRIRFFNAYGPGEKYHPYRSVVCLFVYSALMGIPYTVYQGYHRVFMYIADAVRTLANVSENFIPGRVYNVGGEEYRSVEDLHRIICKNVGPTNVVLLTRDGHNTVNKRPDIALARKELDHQLTVTLEEGVKETIQWMRSQLSCPITIANSSRIAH